MDDRELYHLMFNAATDALNAIEEMNFGEARRILITAQQKAEDGYLCRSDGEEARPEAEFSPGTAE